MACLWRWTLSYRSLQIANTAASAGRWILPRAWMQPWETASCTLLSSGCSNSSNSDTTTPSQPKVKSILEDSDMYMILKRLRLAQLPSGVALLHQEQKQSHDAVSNQSLKCQLVKLTDCQSQEKWWWHWCLTTGSHRLTWPATHKHAQSACLAKSTADASDAQQHLLYTGNFKVIHVFSTQSCTWKFTIILFGLVLREQCWLRLHAHQGSIDAPVWLWSAHPVSSH